MQECTISHILFRYFQQLKAIQIQSQVSVTTGGLARRHTHRVRKLHQCNVKHTPGLLHSGLWRTNPGSYDDNPPGVQLGCSGLSHIFIPATQEESSLMSSAVPSVKLVAIVGIISLVNQLLDGILLVNGHPCNDAVLARLPVTNALTGILFWPFLRFLSSFNQMIDNDDEPLVCVTSDTPVLNTVAADLLVLAALPLPLLCGWTCVIKQSTV